MRVRELVVIATSIVGLLATACGDDERSNAALAPPKRPNRPDSGAPPPPPPPPPPPAVDAGPPEDAGIFGHDSGQLRVECEDIAPVPFIGEDIGDEYANAIAMPTDLRASRVVGTWAGTCSPAAVKVEMSNGRCPDGDGHELVFVLDAVALRDGVLGIGIHEIVPETAGGPIFVRYTRTDRFAPAGEWGTCEGVSGTLNIRGEPGVQRFDKLQALFELKLTPCDGSELPVQSIQGTFNVELQRSLDTVCPAI
jgi:hypothetical protein